MSRKEEIQERIVELEKEIANFEPDVDDYIKQYEEALDEQGDIVIGSLTYLPSQVLKEVDPTAYRCGLLDYVDSLEIEPTELQEELEAIQKELEEIE